MLKNWAMSTHIQAQRVYSQSYVGCSTLKTSMERLREGGHKNIPFEICSYNLRGLSSQEKPGELR